jgi:hypothetical protein
MLRGGGEKAEAAAARLVRVDTIPALKDLMEVRKP